jgi:hypothetical protein
MKWCIILRRDFGQYCHRFSECGFVVVDRVGDEDMFPLREKPRQIESGNCENAANDVSVREANLGNLDSPEGFHGGIVGDGEAGQGGIVVEELEIQRVELQELRRVSPAWRCIAGYGTGVCNIGDCRIWGVCRRRIPACL